jgi:hypothetical protein
MLLFFNMPGVHVCAVLSSLQKPVCVCWHDPCLPLADLNFLLVQCAPFHAVCQASPTAAVANAQWPTNCRGASPGGFSYPGQTCTATCNSGFAGDPSPTVTCSSNGTWTDLTGACVEGDN